MDISPTPQLLQTITRDVGRSYAIAAGIGSVVLIFLPTWLTYILVFSVALCFLTNVIAPFIIDWKPKKYIKANGKAVFITGCDSGFGHVLAKRLDGLEFCVFAGCLLPDGEGAKNLKKSRSSRFHIVPLDVTKEKSVADAAEYVKNNLENNELWAVVSNAGINSGADLMFTDVDTIKRVVEVNTMGVVRVTKAFLPLICESKGRVAVVASSAGRCTFPGMVPYCMSKHATVSFCDGLRMEMYRFGVQVASIEPWMYRTAITNPESTSKGATATWDKAPDDIRRMYPNGYLDVYIKCIENMLNFSTSDNLDEVTDCLVDAIMSKKPKFSYNPGTLYSRTSFWLTGRLPKAIADILFLNTFQYKIVKEHLDEFQLRS